MVSIGHADPMASLPADIAPQPLTQALDEFSRKTGLQFAVKSDLAADLQSKGARATQSAAEAQASPATNVLNLRANITWSSFGLALLWTTP